MTADSRAMCARSRRRMMGSRGSRGGWDSTSGSGGSRARPKAGKISVNRLIHSNCIGPSGCPSPNATPQSMIWISLKLVESKKRRVLRILS